MQAESEMWVTVRAAARITKLSPHTICRRCREGKLPTKRVGREWRINLGHLKQATVAPDGYMTTDDAAKKYGFSKSWVHQMGRRGRIKGIRMGRVLWVEKKSLEDWISRPHEKPTADKARVVTQWLKESGAFDHEYTPTMMQLIEIGREAGLSFSIATLLEAMRAIGYRKSERSHSEAIRQWLNLHWFRFIDKSTNDAYQAFLADTGLTCSDGLFSEVKSVWYRKHIRAGEQS